MTKQPRVPLTADDVDKLMSVCGRGETGHRNRCLLLLVHRTGLRISEALALEPSDLDGNQVHVRHGKGGKSRYVTIKGYATFLPLLEKWLAVRQSRQLRGPLFCTLKGGARRYGLRAGSDWPPAEESGHRKASALPRSEAWSRPRVATGWRRSFHNRQPAWAFSPHYHRPLCQVERSARQTLCRVARLSHLIRI